jgi:hypothetical protein
MGIREDLDDFLADDEEPSAMRALLSSSTSSRETETLHAPATAS